MLVLLRLVIFDTCIHFVIDTVALTFLFLFNRINEKFVGKISRFVGAISVNFLIIVIWLIGVVCRDYTVINIIVIIIVDC